MKQRDLCRHVDTDLMRIAAAYFVVLLHSAADTASISIFYNGISRFSVPVFVMISGYYMLHRQRTMGEVLRKAATMLGLMVLCSSLYYGYEVMAGIRVFGGFSDVLRYLLTEPVHLWYLSAAAALYAMTPMLYVFCAHASKSLYEYALFFTFFFGCLITTLLRTDMFEVLEVVMDRTKIPYLLGFVFLYLMGGYFDRYEISRNCRRFCYGIGVFGVLATVLGTEILCRMGHETAVLTSFFAPNVVVSGVAFFQGMKILFNRRPIQNSKLVTAIHRLAGLTLGIYLLHPMMLSLLDHIGIFGNVPLWIGHPIKALAAFAAAALLSWICQIFLRAIKKAF